MTELLNIGNCCFICSQIDFLPTSCHSCQNKFCKDHIHVEAHSCPTANRNNPMEPFAKLQRCSLEGCQNPSLNASSLSYSIPTCMTCRGSFCAEHRGPATHNCSSKKAVPAPGGRNETARALLVKNFTSSTGSKSAVKRRVDAKSPDPRKLAQFRKLELMKLRQCASPLHHKHQKSELPVEQCLFFKASLDKGIPKNLWVEKDVTTGKAFDLLAVQFGIPVTEIDRYQLLQVSNEAEHLVPLLYDQLLADQIEDGGELLLLKR